MANLSGDGIAPHVVERVLEFLNNAQSAEYFTSLPYLHDYLGHHNYDPANSAPISTAVANNILAKRGTLGGAFTDLSQLSNINGFGQPEFYELVQFFSGQLSQSSGPMPTVDLLSFVTLHKPEDNQAASLSDNFITKTMDGDTSATVARVPMGNLPSFADLKNWYDRTWEWNVYIKEHRNTLQVSKLLSFTNRNPFDLSGLNKVWEILAHTFDSGPADAKLREAALMILVGNHVMRQFNFAVRDKKPFLNDNAHWRRLANAKVVLPKNFLNNTSPNVPVAIPQLPIPSRDRKHRAQHLGLVALQESRYWKDLLEEFIDLDRQHKKERANAEDTANAAYDRQVETIFRQIDQGSSIQYTTKAGEEDDYPYDQIPPFQFDFDSALSAAYTNGKLSAHALDFVQRNRLVDRSAAEAIERAQLQLRKAENRSGARFQKKVGTLRINTVPTTAKPYHSYAFSADRIRQINPSANVPIYFSFHTGYNGAFFKNFLVSIFVSGTTLTDRTPQLLYNENGVIFIRMFASSGVPLNLAQQSTYTLNFDFLLDNNQRFVFSAEAHVQSEVSNGVTSVQASANTRVPAGRTTQLHGFSKLGIATYRRLEQQLCCYVPGEVSHIENIMAREYKEKTTSLVTETVDERESTETGVTTSQLTATDETRFAMSQSIQQIIDRDIGYTSTSTGTLGSVFGLGQYYNSNFSLSLSRGLTFSNSNQTTDNEAREFAEDLTRQAVETIQKTTVERRLSTITKTATQSYNHGFDNRSGNEHVTGIYRWIDKIYKNQVVDYGKRLLYEFMIPEPAKFFHQVFYAMAEEGEVSDSGGVSLLNPPTPLSQQGINSADDITRDNYQNLAAIYGADVVAPMEEFQYDAANLSGGVGRKNDEQDKTFTMMVPADYECIEITFNVRYNYLSRTGTKAHISISGGGNNWQRRDIRGKGNGSVLETFAVSNIAGQIPVNVNIFKVPSYTGTASIKCRYSASSFRQWQQDAYQTILSAYEDQLRAYELAKAANEAEIDQENAEQSEATNRLSHSALNQQLIIRELKRLAIEMLTRAHDIDMGGDFYTDGECDVPELDLGEALDDYGSVVKFFEQAFDWELMAYLFYPYYWAKRCDWADLMKRQNGKDMAFEQFLQAGMGRMVVPVRLGFEDAVMFYQQTGQVWTGTGISIDDPLYLSIQEELATPTGEAVGDPWFTTVPSTLNIIQAGSAYLAEEGLPCCGEEGLGERKGNLLGGGSLLEGKDE